MGLHIFAMAALVGLSVAGYTLEDDYLSGGNFFSKFTFFNAADPTNGFVQYVDQTTAQQAGYINESSSSVYIGTDYHNVASSSGRQSVRITSNKSYNAGTLIILDLAHMPGGECGTWPAFWTVGPNWPNEGEIDIIEGVNSAKTNAMTLHTSSGCTINNSGNFTGSVSTSNCYIDAAGQSNNAGCSITTTNTQTYGAGFNAIGGGVYAMDFESNAITVWFFPRSSIPSDIKSGWPNPSGWSEPIAQFSGGCNIPSYFQNQQIVFDLTFCGDWASAVWSSDSTCAPLASTCNAYVQNTPSAFQNAYWQINSLKTYQNSGTGPAGPSSSASLASTTTTSPSTSSAPQISTSTSPSLTTTKTTTTSTSPATSTKPTTTASTQSTTTTPASTTTEERTWTWTHPHWHPTQKA